MKTLSAEQKLKLDSPLPPEAIKPHPTKAFLSTIKAIYVTERFNEVFGVNGWHIETDLLHWFEKTTTKGKPEFTCVLKTKFSAPEYGIWHECIAGSSNEDFGDASKGGTTDAITKIGSYMGVGADVYKGLKSDSKKDAKPEAQPQSENSVKTSKPTEWLNPGTPQWEHSLKRIQEGMKIEDLKKLFLISKANEAKLNEKPA